MAVSTAVAVRLSLTTDMVGLSSLSSVTHQLGRLETRGYIRRDPKLPRAIEVLDENGVGIHGPPLPT